MPQYTYPGRYAKNPTLKPWATVEARAIGRGGVIRAGLRELDTPVPPDDRRPPPGGYAVRGADGSLLVDLVTRGDLMSPLRWTCNFAPRDAHHPHEAVVRELVSIRDDHELLRAFFLSDLPMPLVLS